MAKAQQSAKAKIPDILASLSDLGSLRKACAQHEVPKGTFLGWIAEDPALADQYARAREIGLEAMAEEILDISDDSGVDVFLDQATGKWTVNGEAVARARLRTDNRKWLLSKCLPKKYGDKLDLTSGGDKLPSTTVTITRHVIGEGA
jgi:hypothetical protein